MNKTDLKNFAVSARVELLSRVRDRAALYGITEEKCRSKAVAPSDTFQKLGGGMLSRHEAAQREALLAQIRRKGFSQVMEEAAYTWFNRFIALKYMEEHRLLPIEQRVMPEKAGEMPQIVREAQRVELDGLALDQVIQMLEENRTEELYKALVMALCNQLSAALPQMFEQIADYTELLFPGGILKAESVLGMMAKLNSPEDNNWADIQVIGWLYQYYISEKHDEVVDINGAAIRKEDIPAATCLYTTDWVVRYMVENSLGRLWLDGHPDHNLQAQWRYYMEEAEQEPEVAAKLAEQRKQAAMSRLEQIKVLDPCMGSGHILVYAFDVLMTIYRSVGYTERDAVESIIANNLYGLDIDDRAAQLAYFSLMMKACEYDRRFLRRGLQPHVYAIQESQNIVTDDLACFGALKQQALDLYHTFVDAKEYGSILQVPLAMEELVGLSAVCDRMLQEADRSSLLEIAAMQRSCALAIQAIIPQAMILARKYDAVITNPPYMNKYPANLKRYIQENYADYKSDLFSVFMYRNFDLCKENGYTGFMTPFVWMFIKSYEKLREYIFQKKCITTLIQMEYSAFEEATVPICTFVLHNTKINYTGIYLRLSDFKGGMDVQNEKVLEAQADPACKYRYTARQDNFSKIPGAPVAYWASKAIVNAFTTMKSIGEIGIVRNGMKTGDNDTFCRLWWEVASVNMCMTAIDKISAIKSNAKWFPYNKGGEYKKWYGNNDWVVNWYDAGRRVIGHAKAEGRHVQDYPDSMKFLPALTWSLITSSKPSFRYKEYHISDIAGMSIYADRDTIIKVLGLLNSDVALKMLNMIAPTINFQAGDIARIPYSQSNNSYIVTEHNIDLAKDDWDSFETSWDFQRHPLI